EIGEAHCELTIRRFLRTGMHHFAASDPRGGVRGEIEVGEHLLDGDAPGTRRRPRHQKQRGFRANSEALAHHAPVFGARAPATRARPARALAAPPRNRCLDAASAASPTPSTRAPGSPCARGWPG